MHQNWKRFLSIVMALAMVMSLLTTTTWATDGEITPSGSTMEEQTVTEKEQETETPPSDGDTQGEEIVPAKTGTNVLEENDVEDETSEAGEETPIPENLPDTEPVDPIIEETEEGQDLPSDGDTQGEEKAPAKTGTDALEENDAENETTETGEETPVPENTSDTERVGPTIEETEEVRTFDISKGNITIVDDDSEDGHLKVTYGSNEKEDNIDPNDILTIIGETEENRIVVDTSSERTVNITFKNVSIDVNKLDECAFNIQNNSDINLMLEGENTLKSGSNYAGLQVQEKDDNKASVTISGTGSLNATGSGEDMNSGAGIGGGSCCAGGMITITGGTVTATGGSDSAGIGGGSGGTGGIITIESGTIIATGEIEGAGIGGGSGCAGGTITITGGTVTATGGEIHSAGIGGGNGGAGGTVTIKGGTVTATGGEFNSAGIGGGTDGDGGTVTISGGAKVYAAGVDTEDIGKGSGGKNSGSLSISGRDTVVFTNSKTQPSYDVDQSSYVFTKVEDEIHAKLAELKLNEKGPWKYANGMYLALPANPIIEPGTYDLSVYGDMTKQLVVGKGTDALSDVILTGKNNDVELVLEDQTTVTLKDVNITGAAAITVKKTATIKLEGTNVVESSSGAGISVPEGTSLTIEGNGSLKAIGGDLSAGIGGGFDGAGGMITIKDGTVTATGGCGAAGIGGGSMAAGGTIIIESGTVTATSTNSGAGIGGGVKGAGGKITIYGGTVTTTGSAGGAGIGGGIRGAGGEITINGGTITATGGSDAAGIGDGQQGNGATVMIAGGARVHAAGSADAEDIGKGKGDNELTSGSLTVSGADTVVFTNSETQPEYNADQSSYVFIKDEDEISAKRTELNLTNKPWTSAEGMYLGCTYQVTVNGGTTDQDKYAENDTVTIKATVPSGKVLKKWTSSDEILFANANSAETTFTMPAKAVTVTANFADKTRFDLSGTVTSDSSPVNGATVVLKQGNEKIKESTTNTSGEYNFTDLTNGVYNLVVTNGLEGESNKTVTSLIVIQNKDVTQDLTLPSNKKDSILEVTGTDTPAIVVGGLDEVAKDASEDQVVITMTVEKKAEDEAVNAAEIKKVSSGKQLDFLDMEVNKTVNGTSEHLSEVGEVLEIVIPYNFAGKSEVKVYRYHETAVNTFTKLESKPVEGYKDGTYYLDDTNGLIYVYTQKFSTYAVGYQTAEQKTITLDANGGSISSTTILTGTDGKLDTLPTPTRSGEYDFDGWYTAENGGTKVTTDTVFGADTTIYAHWTHHSSSSSGGSSHHSYDITIKVEGKGKITPDGGSDHILKVRRRSNQTVTITANEGYQICDVLVDGKSVGVVDEYTFEKVRKDHTIKAVFEPDSSTKGQNPFNDVTEDDWFYDEVLTVSEKGLMAGTSNKTFSPYLGTSRSMIATILHRLEDKPEHSKSNPFSDVLEQAWYTDGIAWCAEHGIVEGYGAENYKPNQIITREELCAILYRYAQYKGLDVKQNVQLSAFVDENQIGDWAKDAVRFAVAAKLMKGNAHYQFQPKNQATRAEVAAVIYNLLLIQ